MRSGQRMLAVVLAGLALLVGAGQTWAQSFGGSGGSSGGGSSGGSSSFGGSGSSMGSGGGSSSSSFLGTSTSNNFLGTSSTSTTNTNSNGVGSTSFLGQNYATPVAQGIGSATNSSGTTTTTTNFGTAIYQNLTTTTGSSGSGGRSGSSSSSYGLGSSGGSSSRSSFGSGGTGTYRSGSSSSSSTTMPFATSAGTLRAPTYYAELGFARAAPLAAGDMRSNLQAALANSNRLSRPDQIAVDVNNGVTVLRGTVATERERNVAEAMVRLSPGVGEVRNELVLAGPPASP